MRYRQNKKKEAFQLKLIFLFFNASFEKSALLAGTPAMMNVSKKELVGADILSVPAIKKTSAFSVYLTQGIKSYRNLHSGNYKRIHHPLVNKYADHISQSKQVIKFRAGKDKHYRHAAKHGQSNGVELHDHSSFFTYRIIH